MNELLAQAYGTEANVAVNTGGDTEKTAEAVLLEELEKIAADEGIDLNEFDDNDILDIIGEAMGETEKTAAADVDEEGQEKLAEADFLGRTMAHAFYDELTTIQNGGVTKTADAEVAEAFEAAAIERAEEVLAYFDGQGEIKTSSIAENDENLDGNIDERAAELLMDAGYDVEAMTEALLDD